MSETKFTRGPWFTSPNLIGIRTKLADTKESEVGIATALTLPFRSVLERDANAQLIAAAPDMYLALVEAYAFLGTPETHPQDDSGMFELSALIKQTLAKARGEA